MTQKVRNALCPALCTRIIEVLVLGLTPGINRKIANRGDCRPWDDHSPGLTKLHVFRLEVYDTIVFIEPDCLVLDDIYPLIQKGKVYTETEALVAAAPDMFPPDKFNSGVMVIRPSQTVFDNMMAQKSLLANYDGGDTGFLNAYYPEWHDKMAPLARLPFSYNAQRALYDVTYNKGHRNYWDVAVAPDLKILHYSGSEKPWEGPPSKSNDNDDKVSATDPMTMRTGDYLTDLWRQWYQRSKNFVARHRKEKEREEAWKASAEIRHKQQEMQAVQKENQKDPKQVHKLVSKRFKELRQQGHNAKDAMTMARQEAGLQDEEEEPAAVGAKVAAMFGVMM